MAKKLTKGNGKNQLHKGESQRKDDLFSYRWTDNGKRRDIYAKTLAELRAKEQQIQSDLKDGINFFNSNILVKDAVAEYLRMKRAPKRQQGTNELKYLKPNTDKSYSAPFKRIENSKLGNTTISKVTSSIAKDYFREFVPKLQYRTMQADYNLLHGAFCECVENDCIRKNIFDGFSLSDDTIYGKQERQQKRVGLTDQQYEDYLSFVKQLNGDYENEIIILGETGLRVGELYGLTWNNIDLNSNETSVIRVEKQLYKASNDNTKGKDIYAKYIVSPPKSKNGIRMIPLTDNAVKAFQREKEKYDLMNVHNPVNGRNDWVFYDKTGKPKYELHLQNWMRYAKSKWGLYHSREEMPFKCTPHELRHTAASRWANQGMKPHILQAIMGHSDIRTTMNVYVTSTEDNIIKEFNIINNI